MRFALIQRQHADHYACANAENQIRTKLTCMLAGRCFAAFNLASSAPSPLRSPALTI
jgi:hypothetical protein